MSAQTFNNGRRIEFAYIVNFGFLNEEVIAYI